MKSAQNFVTGAVGAVLLSALPAAAQTYPSKPIRIIAPFAPGGGVDYISRVMGQRLAGPLGQQLLVDNRPGAGGSIGTELGVTAPADGYTLTMISSSYPVLPSLYKLPYDPLADIAPIILVVKTPFIAIVHPSLPVKTLKELIAFAKARPGEINFGSAGTGSGVHLGTELFMYQAAIRMSHIPYKGAAPALSDLLGGQVMLLFNNPLTAMPHMKSGRVRALAVTSSQRMKADPTLPTIAEAGVPGYEVLDWSALIAPKGTPQAIVDRINGEVAKVLASKEFEDRLIQDGIAVGGGTPGDLLTMIRREIETWRKLVTAAGIKVN